MSDNKGFDSMRDLVRALQQTEYGLRTGNLSADDVGKACDNARELYERLVVIRHKSREDRVHEEVLVAAPAKAEVMAKASAPLIEPTASAPALAERGSEPAKGKDAPKAQAPVKEPTAPPPAVVKAVVAAKAPEPMERPTPIAPVEVKAVSSPDVGKAEVLAKALEPAKEPTAPTQVVAKPASVPDAAMAEVVAKAPVLLKEPTAATPTPAVVNEASAPVITQASAEATPKAAGSTTSVVTTPSPAPKQELAVGATKEAVPAPQQTSAIEVTAEVEKVKNDAPKSASDFLKDANVTPAPAPEMAAIRAQQVVARSGPAPSPVLVTTVAEKMEKAHINDLAKAVTVSHKFWFTTELFGGDRGAYESGMARLNSAKDLAGARALLENEILPKLKKPAHEEALNAFSELLQRRFE